MARKKKPKKTAKNDRHTLLSIFAISGLLLLVSSIYFYTTYRGSSATASREKIRVMTLNVDRYVLSSAAAEEKMRLLAEYLISHDIAIAALQEMDTGAAVSAQDYSLMLALNMAERGRPVEIYERTYQDGDQTFRSSIVSRYSASPGSYREFALTPSAREALPNDTNRWMPTVQIHTPVGVVRIGSVHVGGAAYACESIRTVGVVMAHHFVSDPTMLILGDFNSTSCTSAWSELMLRTDLLSDTAGNSHILAATPNVFNVVSVRADSGYTGSRHAPIVAEIALKDELADIADVPGPIPAEMGIPTVTPYGGPCAVQKKAGDYDCSGTVDIQDFHRWVADFNAKKAQFADLEYWRRAYY